MKLTIIIISFLLSLSSFAGGSGAGNGGDTVRMRFFNIGNNILNYYQSGFNEVKSVIKSPEDLRQYLNIDVVKTSVELLVDNGGSVVSAIGEKNKIILYVGESHPELSWNTILNDPRVSLKMILHEMLRAHGVNDDNYVYTDIILRKQDVNTTGKFKMKWSENNTRYINSALLSSLSGLTSSQEIKLHNETIKKLQENNDLPYANLLSLKLLLTLAISEKLNDPEPVLPLLRRDFRETKDLINYVDMLAYTSIISEKTSLKDIRKAGMIIFRDFSFKYLKYSELDSRIFLTHLKMVKHALHGDDFFKNSCTHINDLMEETSQLLETREQSRVILKNLELMAYLLQQGNC